MTKPVVVDLGTLAPQQGYIVQGQAAGHSAGRSVSSAGDVNGDGIDDVIVGAPGADDSGGDAGNAYLIYGVAGAAGEMLDLGELTASKGFMIRGAAAGDRVGSSVSSAGDVNGDGIDDLIVGAPGGDDGGSSAGQAYVIYGVLGDARGTLDLSALSASEGFVIQGDSDGDLTGHSVSSAGDVNGDGIDDMIIGAPEGDDGGSGAGEAYVIFGVAGHTRGRLDLSGLTETDGFIIQGDTDGDKAGFSVSAAGDVNGDSIDDLIVGANWGDDRGTNAGEAYIVYGLTGSTRGTLELSDLVMGDGFTVKGETGYDNAGLSVSAAGDINGDGIDDLMVGAPGGKLYDRGEVILIYGLAGNTRSDVHPSNLTPGDGFVIEGHFYHEFAGFSVSAAGDVNGDGIDDMIIGAPQSATTAYDSFYYYVGKGHTYVIFGMEGSTRGKLDLLDMTATDGFIIEGDAPGDRAGWSVSSAGDVNADGFDDLIVGAPNGDDAGRNAGEGYVIYGLNPLRIGTDLGEAIFGSNLYEMLIGLGGDDTLEGGDGADTLDGGEGNDTASYASDTDGVRVSLAARLATGGHADGDVLISIENLLGGAGDDALTGAGNDNALTGGAGDDTLDGQSGADALFGDIGDDLLEGGSEGDTLDGGEGNDTISYASDTSGVEISLLSNSAGGGDASGDILISFENLIGGGGDDSLTGDEDTNNLNGRKGDDFLTGRGGDDTLISGGGEDTLIGGGGDDVMVAGANNDILEGGDGADTLDGGEDSDTASYDSDTDGVQVSLAAGLATGGHADGDVLISIENLLGGAGDDALTGAGNDNALTGGAGDDTLDGQSGADALFGDIGDDLLEGGSEGDTMDGGEGNDTISYASDTSGVEISLLSNSAGGGDASGDILISFENLIGGGGDDSLTGDGVANALIGAEGSDILDGRGGDDTLEGGDGNDTVFGGDGRDRALLGDGNDLFADTSQGGERGRDTVFAGNGDDTIQGGNGDDEFHGMAGNDLISGRLGNDLILGGAGDDKLHGGDGDDTVFGGDGHDDVLLGNGDDLFADSSQEGDQGDNTVFAGEGNDTLIGSNGDDQFHGLAGDDLMLGRLGDDLITGGVGFDTLDGGDGNDTVFGGDGRDRVALGEGNDVFFDTSQGGERGRDTVFAGAGDDTIQGGNGDDEFHGMTGDDLISGRLGHDLIFGGTGDDKLHGGDGNDTVHGGEGRDRVLLGTGDDLFFDTSQGGEQGRDTVFAGAGDDTIQGGNGDDIFRGELGDDVIFARLGNDTVIAGAGNDTLDGGAGADTFVFGPGFGADRINGYEKGTDKLEFDDALWSGTLSAAQVVSRFATDTGSDIRFDFGGGNTVLLAGAGDLPGLADDLVIA